MNLTANLRHRIRKHAIVRIKRKILGEGEIKVKQGEKIEPHDILGNFQVSGGYSKIDLATELGVSNEEGVKYLNKGSGEKIYKGEVLASKLGFFGNKELRAPTDAVIGEYDAKSGKLTLKFLPKEDKLLSGVYGIVEKVIVGSKEVVIKTMVTEIYGVFGSGNERSGILQFVDGRGNLMSKRLVSPVMKGRIIVSGALVYKDALHALVEFGVSGIITGGMNAKDYLSMVGSINPMQRIGTDIGISIVASEGFGPVQIGEDIYSELKLFDGKFIFVNGNSTIIQLPDLDPDSFITVQKTALPDIVLPPHQPELVIKNIELGDKVRVIWSPFFGAQGLILSIDKQPTILPSGIKTYLLTVELPNRKIKVPYPNVEII